MCDNCKLITLSYGGSFKNTEMMVHTLYPIYYALEAEAREDLGCGARDVSKQDFELLMVAKWNEYARLN